MLVPYESFITRRDQGHRGLPAGVVRRVVGDVLRGLDALHRLCGIVHTDLKAPAAAQDHEKIRTREATCSYLKSI